jgi:hypothetical protein
VSAGILIRKIFRPEYSFNHEPDRPQINLADLDVRHREHMKRIITFLVCILIGFGIGWYFGYTRPIAENQRELAKDNQFFRDRTQGFDAAAADFKKRSAEEFKSAAPWEASSASIALAVLKNLKTNNLEDAKSRLAAIVALYYRGHSRDGDTNLLTSIVTFAATDTVLSNAIYGKLQ